MKINSINNLLKRKLNIESYYYDSLLQDMKDLDTIRGYYTDSGTIVHTSKALVILYNFVLCIQLVYCIKSNVTKLTFILTLLSAAFMSISFYKSSKNYCKLSNLINSISEDIYLVPRKNHLEYLSTSIKIQDEIDIKIEELEEIENSTYNIVSLKETSSEGCIHYISNNNTYTVDINKAKVFKFYEALEIIGYNNDLSMLKIIDEAL